MHDTFVDYKREMWQCFSDLFEDRIGSDDKEGVSTYDRIC